MQTKRGVDSSGHRTYERLNSRSQLVFSRIRYGMTGRTMQQTLLTFRFSSRIWKPPRGVPSKTFTYIPGRLDSSCFRVIDPYKICPSGSENRMKASIVMLSIGAFATVQGKELCHPYNSKGEENQSGTRCTSAFHRFWSAANSSSGGGNPGLANTHLFDSAGKTRTFPFDGPCLGSKGVSPSGRSRRVLWQTGPHDGNTLHRAVPTGADLITDSTVYRTRQ